MYWITKSNRPARWVVTAAICAVATLVAARVFADAATESQTRLLGGVKYLASDDLEGRGVGTDGLNLAANYIREEFKKAGLDTSRVEGDAFQKFSMVSGTELGSPNTLTLLGPDGTALDLKYDADFRACGFGASAAFDAEIVFCGYAIDDEKNNFREFEGIDVRGKIALIIRRVPQQSNPHGPFNAPHGGISRHGDLRSKVRNAIEHGAAAILFVNDPHTVRENAQQDRNLLEKAEKRVVDAAVELDGVGDGNAESLAAARKKLSAAVAELKSAREEDQKPDNDPLMDLDYRARSQENEIPILQITQAACDRLLKPSLGKTLAELEAAIDGDLKPRSALLAGWKARGTTSLRKIRTEVKNVIGVLEGEGPLANETIVIGAHYDHLGFGGEGSLLPGSKAIHNGADDNASGASSLIELARRLAARDKKLPRRLVFIAFTAEELGLIGSAQYVKQPLFPLDKTIAMFNMDMVGRLKDDKLTVFGSGTAERWTKMLDDLAKAGHFALTLKPGGFGPSDQSSFYAQKIPVLHFFTGTHGDYHRPSDDWDKINAPGMTRIVDMIEKAVVDTAIASEPPKYVEIKESETMDRGGSRPYFGSVPDFASEVKGYAISGVAPGSPADKGGIKAGDAIVQLGGKKIGGLEDFDLVLRGFAPGDEVEVTVLRAGKEVKLKVTLAKPR